MQSRESALLNYSTVAGQNVFLGAQFSRAKPRGVRGKKTENFLNFHS